MPDRTVFATVGTTQFDALTQALVSAEVTELLFQQGYTRLLLQVGRGAEPALPSPALALPVEWYRFKDSLAEDMRSAALIVSHAGAGSIMEGLQCDACLLVVVNDALMDNHQQVRTASSFGTAHGASISWPGLPHGSNAIAHRAHPTNTLCSQELASELDRRSHLVSTTPALLPNALRTLPQRARALQPWPGCDPSAFARYLDSALGLG
jgi:beta-1,4-N-acetylglucosaminyltransferase